MHYEGHYTTGYIAIRLKCGSIHSKGQRFISTEKETRVKCDTTARPGYNVTHHHQPGYRGYSPTHWQNPGYYMSHITMGLVTMATAWHIGRGLVIVVTTWHLTRGLAITHNQCIWTLIWHLFATDCCYCRTRPQTVHWLCHKEQCAGAVTESPTFMCTSLCCALVKHNKGGC